ncbi:MAG: site-2 protease family protein [Candidatus Jordarchaeaceae archaeon]
MDSQGLPPLTLEELRRIVERYFIVFEAYNDLDGIPTFILPSSQETKIPFQKLIESLEEYNLLAILRKAENVPQRYPIFTDHSLLEGGETELILKIFPSPESKKTHSPIMNIILLIATICTVALTGYQQAQSYNHFGIMVNVFAGPEFAWYTDPTLLTILFTVSLFAIIGLHEMGHYFSARIRGQKASLPFFIPGVPPIGTFGALIVQRTPAINRDRLFELGLAGPITGFIITLIILIISIQITPIIYPNVLFQLYSANLQFNQWIISTYGREFFQLLLSLGWPSIWIGFSPYANPLLYEFISPIIKPAFPFSAKPIHPLSWAAWIGMLVTALNLFPIGMLDGGHMARSFLNQRQHLIASIIAAAVMVLISYAYLLMAIFVLFLMPRGGHPGALDDVSPIAKWKIAVFACMIVIAILTLPPLGWSKLF